MTAQTQAQSKPWGCSAPWGCRCQTEAGSGQEKGTTVLAGELSTRKGERDTEGTPGIERGSYLLQSFFHPHLHSLYLTPLGPLLGVPLELLSPSKGHFYSGGHKQNLFSGERLGLLLRGLQKLMPKQCTRKLLMSKKLSYDFFFPPHAQEMKQFKHR